MEIDPPIGGYCIVYAVHSDRYFRLGHFEADLLRSLDGSRNVAQLESRNDRFTKVQIHLLLFWFVRQNLLTGTPLISPQISFASRVLRFLTAPNRVRFKLSDPNKYLDAKRPFIECLFSASAMTVYGCIIVVFPLLAILNPHAVQRELRGYSPHLTVAMVLMLYLMQILMNIIHEFAHAIVCKHNGGSVPRIGIMLMYLTPALYCDVSASWRFPRTEQKVAVSLAGIASQILASSITLTLWLFSGLPVLLEFSLLNLSVAAVNLFPLIKLDGYWVLAHMLNEPNLARDGLRGVDYYTRVFLKGQRPLAPRPRNAVVCFGACHLVVIPVFWALGLFGMYSFVSRWSRGAALVALFLFAVPLAARCLKEGALYVRTLRTGDTLP